MLVGQGGAADPAAAENPLAIIKHGGLARGHGACWSIENEIGFSGATSRVEGCRDSSLC